REAMGAQPIAPPSSQTTDQQLALVDHLFRQVRVQYQEQLLVLDDFAPPLRRVECLHLLERLLRIVQSAPVDVLIARHPAECRLERRYASPDAIHDPPQDAHVVAEAGPEEPPCRVLAEPV